MKLSNFKIWLAIARVNIPGFLVAMVECLVVGLAWIVIIFLLVLSL